MNEQNTKRDAEVEIDVKRMLMAVLHKAWLVGVVSIVCAALAFAGTFFFITPQYQSTAMFYVNNNSLSVGSATLSLSSSDISASRGLVKTYIVILNTRETLMDVIDYAGVNMSWSELRGKIQAQSVNETEVFSVTVTDTDPARAEKLASAVAQILPKRISSIVEGTSAKVVDAAVAPSAPSSPSYPKNVMLGFLIGFVLTAGAIALRSMDAFIRDEEDIAQMVEQPILASVPDMAAPSKGAYSKKRIYDTSNSQKKTGLIGEDISFAASEAYKLLRTKLQYSFADEKACRVIGISSALTGEGKSLTAINLAHSLAQLDKRVLLIDCDMRRPSLSKKLPIQKEPGLSGYLSGQKQMQALVQHCGIKGSEESFHVIASGKNPPNPMELLSSARMAKLLEILRGKYDYILLDLPPVCEVSDALAVSKVIDGMLLVVRQHYCNRVALAEAMRQLNFMETRLLGVVYNFAGADANSYMNSYYKHYYNPPGRRYVGNFMAHKDE